MRPPCLLQPHFHIPRHCVDYLEKKRSLPIPLGVPESPGLQQRQRPGTCSFPKYKPHLCTMDPEVGPARKGWRADKSWRYTWLCPHVAPAAQGLQALSQWMVTLSRSPPLRFSKHAFLHWKLVCYFYVGKCLDYYRMASRVSNYPRTWKASAQRTHFEMLSHHALPPFCHGGDSVGTLLWLLSQMSRLEFWLHHLPAVWPKTGRLLCLSFLFC